VSEQSAYFDVEGIRAMAVVPLNHENKVAETFIGANRGTVFMQTFLFLFTNRNGSH
jgi:hypothetical protein